MSISLPDPPGEEPDASVITTSRLELVPASVELLQAALDGAHVLREKLRAEVPASWPNEFLDDAALQYTREKLSQAPHDRMWWMYFILLFRAPAGRTLIGSAGYKGPPSGDGTVEIGYGIVDDHQRCGYATEAARALIERAFACPRVTRVVAETLPELTGSIGVLRKCGFRLEGPGSESGAIRFVLSRQDCEGGLDLSSQ